MLSDIQMTNVVISLTYVYGIGLPTSKEILAAGMFLKIFVFAILHQIKKMLSVVKLTRSKLKVTFVAKVNLNIKRLMEIGSYRGSPSPSWTSSSWTKH